MSISYQAKSSPVLGRQLEAQEIVSVCDLTASPAKSDAPSFISVDATDVAAVEITISIDESIEKCFAAQVIDRATGASLTLAAEPDLSEAKKIKVTADCTGVDSICVKACYKVAE
jgi:hypothetical protein